MLIKVIKKKTILLVLFSLCLMVSLMIATPVAITTVTEEAGEEKKFIKWVDFSVSYAALEAALKLDIDSHTKEGEIPLSMVDMLAYLGSKYGGDFTRFKKSDLTRLQETVKEKNTTIDELGKDLKNYAYFKEAYGAVLNGFVGEYDIEIPSPDNPEEKTTVSRYGLRVFSPLAKGYSYSHFDDFGSARSYGYKRKHLSLNESPVSFGTCKYIRV